MMEETIEGKVIKTSEVMHQVINARFECYSCGAILSVLQFDDKFREPHECTCGRKSLFKLISKERVDSLQLIIERNNNGKLNEITIVLTENMWIEPNKILGKRIKVDGSLIGEYIIEANDITLEEPSEGTEIAAEDEIQILELANDPSLLKRIIDSVAPSVYGFDIFKEAAILQLFGIDNKNGKEKNIHILLNGNLGNAKTEFMKSLTKIFKQNCYLTLNEFEKGNLSADLMQKYNCIFLRGGPITLARGGVIYIDNIEKIEKMNKLEIENAIEEQIVKINYKNDYYPIETNISLFITTDREVGHYLKFKGLTDEFLSKFDLVFNSKDEMSPLKEEKVMSKILDLNGKINPSNIIHNRLLKDYISYARNIYPKLTPEAKKAITNFYVGLRNKSDFLGYSNQLVPIQARQIRSIQKLATAYARVRLSKKVTFDDAMRAIELYKTTTPYRDLESASIEKLTNLQNLATTLKT